MNFIVGFVLVALSVVQGLPAASDLGEIVFSSVLFRHGDRNIAASYPTDPYKDEATYWPRGYGQLTQAGEEREHELGAFLRKRYDGFLPETYNVNDIYIRSSDVDRALVSARCNLHGLYQPTEETRKQENIQFQVAPVHGVPLAEDKLILPIYSCSKYNALLSLLTESPEYKCIENVIKPVTDQVANHAGLPAFHSYIYDTLFVEEQNNLVLPDWTSSYYPDPLKSIYLLETFIAYAANKDLQRLSGGPLLKEIISNMQSKASGTLSPNRKLYYYSAHDATVVDLLMTLQVFNNILVPYSSAVIVELRTNNGEYFVTVSYRNETGNDAYLLQLPDCDALCPLETFVELTKDVIPDDIDAECAEAVPENYEASFPIPAENIPPEWDDCFSITPLATNQKYKYLSVKKNL